MNLKIIKRNIKYWFQRRARSWSDDETWNLDYEFIKWINSRFKKYKELSSKIVDLEDHKFTYKRKKYTQLELINKVIELSDKYLALEGFVPPYLEELDSIKNEIFDIFKIIFWSMWW